MPRRIDKIHNEKRLEALRRGLRNEATSAEAALWNYLRKSQLGGRKFRRQHSIGPYIVDFYCPVEKLVVELDGEPHNAPNRKDYDAEREDYLQEQGVRVVRFENRAVFENMDVVLEGIAWLFAG